MSLYIKPPLITLKNKTYCQGYKTYSEYNYLRPGISSYLKTKHFEVALELTKNYFNKCNVIDFGCADGPFLPSLSNYFNNVVGIDKNPIFIRISSHLCNQLKLSNVKLILNNDLNLKSLQKSISSKKFHILFLLETLEHIGDKKDLYNSKINFLNNLFSLLDENGEIVISVPKMVGLPFLIQRIGLFFFGMNREKISFKNLLMAGLFNNTSDLEKEWKDDHLGFNYKTMEKYIKKEFRIIRKINDLFQIIYVIGKK